MRITLPHNSPVRCDNVLSGTLLSICVVVGRKTRLKMYICFFVCFLTVTLRLIQEALNGNRNIHVCFFSPLFRKCIHCILNTNTLNKNDSVHGYTKKAVTNVGTLKYQFM